MSDELKARLLWVRRDDISAESLAPAAMAATLTPAPKPVGEAHPLQLLVRATGEPRPDTAMSARDEAVFLLQFAAEVEHSLLVQYLFALYSLNATGLPVTSWAGTLRRIAREEMGHLVTLQNLLSALGAPPHLRRERSLTPEVAKLFPFPPSLEPFGLERVKRYVVAESPEGAALPDDLGQLKGAVNHVGVLYLKLYWLFQRSDAPEGPWRLPPSMEFESGHLADEDFADPLELAGRMATAEEWAKNDQTIFVLPDRAPATLTELRDKALEAIFLVAAQGEGLVTQINSHFDRFLKIYTEMKSFAGQVSLPLVHNPATEPRPGGTLITDETTLKWARLGNLRYEIMLLEIEHALSLRRGTTAGADDPRAELVRWAVGGNPNEMFNGLRPIARRLVRLNVAAGGAPAGMPFEPPSAWLPAGERERWERHLDLIRRSRELIDDIGDPALSEIRDALDAARVPFVERQIEANT